MLLLRMLHKSKSGVLIDTQLRCVKVFLMLLLLLRLLGLLRLLRLLLLISNASWV